MTSSSMCEISRLHGVKLIGDLLLPQTEAMSRDRQQGWYNFDILYMCDHLFCCYREPMILYCCRRVNKYLSKLVFGHCLKQLILSTSLYITGADESGLDPYAANQITNEVVWRQLLTMTRAAEFLTDLVDAITQSWELPTLQAPTSPESASLHSAHEVEEHLQASQCINHSCTSE